MINGKFACAVIGYGGMGSWHTQQMKNNKWPIAGIYDIKPERRAEAEKNGIRAYSTREELLADPNIDLVTIATPNEVHKEIAIACLAAGKNVICEKPVAMNCAELEEIIEAAEKYGKLFTVHQNRRWDNDFLTAKKIVDDNVLGKVHRIESRVQGSRGIPGDWRSQKPHGGGMVMDWGVHLFDQALQIGGGRRLLSVHADLTNVTTDEVDDGFYATLNFEGGLSYYVEVTTNNFIELPRWYVLGQNGSAVVENWELKGKIIKVSHWEDRDAVPIQAGAGLTKTMAPRNRKTIKKYKLTKVKSDWSEYYKNIFAVLEGKAAPIVTHAQQRRLIKLIEAVFRSAETGEVVKFEE